MKKIKSLLLRADQLFFNGYIKAYYSRQLKYRGKAQRLTSDLYFPPHTVANQNVRLGPNGELLAIGGDLSPDRMIKAFKNGIYPMSFENEPILWWTSETRVILFLKNLHIGRDVRKFIRQEQFHLSTDKAYDEVVKACSELRKGSTWLTPERIEATLELHRLGVSHSVEVWQNEELIGGLFGNLIGSYFYTESMFTRRKHSSRVAFTAIALRLQELNFTMIDLGIWPTENLKSYGAVSINRDEYLELLNKSLNAPEIFVNWINLFENWDLKLAVEKHRASESSN